MGGRPSHALAFTCDSQAYASEEAQRERPEGRECGGLRRAPVGLRIASPEMFPNVDPLPHLKSSRPSERPNRSNSHSPKSDRTTKLPANESRLTALRNGGALLHPEVRTIAAR